MPKEYLLELKKKYFQKCKCYLTEKVLKLCPLEKKDFFF